MILLLLLILVAHQIHDLAIHEIVMPPCSPLGAGAVDAASEETPGPKPAEGHDGHDGDLDVVGDEVDGGEDGEDGVPALDYRGT